MSFSGQFDGNPLNRLKAMAGLDKPQSSAKRLRELTRYVKDHKAERLATFAGVHVFADRIVKLPNVTGGLAGITEDCDERPVEGLTAVVEQSGEVQSRGTLTRSLLVTGWQKRDDKREARLLVSGPGWNWAVPVPMRDLEAAQKFAVELSTFAYGTPGE